MIGERTPVFYIFLIFLRLGLTSFGGPIAHLAYLREEFVTRRKWLNEHSYADLVTLCQFLPGPASSQIGMALGLARGGIAGSIAAWMGFTLPSAVLLSALALLAPSLVHIAGDSFLHGLRLGAVSVVAQAVWTMGASVCPSRKHLTIAVSSACAVLVLEGAVFHIAAITMGALAGLFFLSNGAATMHTPLRIPLGRFGAGLSALTLVTLLIALPILSRMSGSHTIDLVDHFFRVGTMVFGGGHVVLPLLQREVVPAGWVTNETFIAGYGAAQAIPGPLFTFAAYLGAANAFAPNGWTGAAICLVAIFAPSFLILWGALPYWDQIRQNHWVRSGMQGANASVVGILLAALYHPVWTNAVTDSADFAVVCIAFVALVLWKVPSWAIVLFVTTAAVVLHELP